MHQGGRSVAGEVAGMSWRGNLAMFGVGLWIPLPAWLNTGLPFGPVQWTLLVIGAGLCIPAFWCWARRAR